GESAAGRLDVDVQRAVPRGGEQEELLVVGIGRRAREAALAAAIELNARGEGVIEIVEFQAAGERLADLRKIECRGDPALSAARVGIALEEGGVAAVDAPAAELGGAHEDQSDLAPVRARQLAEPAGHLGAARLPAQEHRVQRADVALVLAAD